ncbi:hypothetical protein [Pararcticibacter amylolyticus]|uniref:Uncharacterized protein n=1 Tax=Pararcticibacter amylolyticus TaxID=2173175 RepID=A0A2U2PB09_9SPHI|nr:hypothetical protein [Pararcticibacter amylolyticus]PWG78591.1 hypothetical protein DDR33_21755 [Pararcticibacter amylolyticus]
MKIGVLTSADMTRAFIWSKNLYFPDATPDIHRYTKEQGDLGIFTDNWLKTGDFPLAYIEINVASPGGERSFSNLKVLSQNTDKAVAFFYETGYSGAKVPFEGDIPPNFLGVYSRAGLSNENPEFKAAIEKYLGSFPGDKPETALELSKAFVREPKIDKSSDYYKEKAYLENLPDGETNYTGDVEEKPDAQFQKSISPVPDFWNPGMNNSDVNAAAPTVAGTVNQFTKTNNQDFKGPEESKNPEDDNADDHD